MDSYPPGADAISLIPAPALSAVYGYPGWTNWSGYLAPVLPSTCRVAVHSGDSGVWDDQELERHGGMTAVPGTGMMEYSKLCLNRAEMRVGGETCDEKARVSSASCTSCSWYFAER